MDASGVTRRASFPIGPIEDREQSNILSARATPVGIDPIGLKTTQSAPHTPIDLMNA